MAISEQYDYVESESDSYDSCDSEEDPSFDILEQSRSRLSKLSIDKSSISDDIDKETEETNVAEPDQQGVFEIVEKCIQAGQLDRLKVDQCKIYLRKHGLRLSGNKDTLIERIKEHLDILNIGGGKKYPASSFTVNCKGDACMGDVVMFEQTVYEMFNIASRSSIGPPLGTRSVVGRIVKESYGASKQQHTFTIEVLWSKGERPHPPLHPLLIKGRNLYKLKTMRQRWKDEGERQKILLEKHNRGSIARLNRDTRIQEKETRKILKANRLLKYENQNNKTGENHTSKTSVSVASNSRKWRQPNDQQNLYPTYRSLPVNVAADIPRMQPEMQKSSRYEHGLQRNCLYPTPTESSDGGFCTRQVLANINQSFHGYRPNMIHNQFRGQFPQDRTSILGPRPMIQRTQLCRCYAQGRCSFGERCKYLHES